MALSKNRIWKSLGYRPHQGQRPVHNSRARHKVFSAGRRTGKSQVGGHELTPECLYTYGITDALKQLSHRREFWIVGPEYSDSEKEFRVLWNDLTKLEVPFDKPGSYNNPLSGEMHISCWGGLFQVHAKSAKYPTTLVGEGLSGVILAEAAKLKPVVWHKFIRPTLADFRGWSLHSSTPEGKNWYYELWQRGQDPTDEEWASWRMPSWVNDVIFPGGEQDPEIRDMAKDMSEERYNQEIGALFTEFVGGVFKQFDEEIHVTDLRYHPEWPLYIAVDYGWSNPFVLLLIQVDVWDNVYVIGEFRTHHQDITEIATALRTWRDGIVLKCATDIFPDPATPGDTNVLCRELRLQDRGGTGGEIKYRLERIRQWLKLGPEHVPWEDRVPKLYIDRSCQGMPLNDGGMIREMQDYRYPDRKSETREAPEVPMKKDDHAPEALGRFFAGYFGSPADNRGGRARVSKAKVTA